MSLKMTGGETEIIKKGPLLGGGKRICPFATVTPLMDFTIDLNAENRTLVLRRFAVLDFIYVLNKHCVLCNYVTNNKKNQHYHKDLAIALTYKPLGSKVMWFFYSCRTNIVVLFCFFVSQQTQMEKKKKKLLIWKFLLSKCCIMCNTFPKREEGHKKVLWYTRRWYQPPLAWLRFFFHNLSCPLPWRWRVLNGWMLSLGTELQTGVTRPKVLLSRNRYDQLLSAAASFSLPFHSAYMSTDYWNYAHLMLHCGYVFNIPNVFI